MTTEEIVLADRPHQAQVTLMADAEIDRLARLASNLAASGFFKDAQKAEQAFAKMLLGHDLGLTPTQALTALHIVEGKPELSANLQAQLVRTYVGPAGERYDYKVLTPADQRDVECEIEFSRNGEPLGVEKFTMDDAARAGLANRNVWKSYPRNMLFARCISNGVAFHCPEVTNGLRVYHEGEVGGPVVEATVEDVTTMDVTPPRSAPSDVTPDLLTRQQYKALQTAFKATRDAGSDPTDVINAWLAEKDVPGPDMAHKIAALSPEQADELLDFLTGGDSE